jgi:hypothetical protein
MLKKKMEELKMQKDENMDFFSAVFQIFEKEKTVFIFRKKISPF